MNTASVIELIRTQEKFACSDGFSMDAYVARPKRSSRLPVLLFIYEIFGMNPEMARLADELASEGYVVMIPDLFSRGSWFSCVRKIMTDLKAGKGQGVQDLIEARKWLVRQSYADPERVAVMGLCMGGGFALLLGKTGLFRVSAPFYGQAPQSLDAICPVVGSYGGRDTWLLKDAQRLEQELTKRGVPHDVKIYPDAGHSFMNQPSNGFVKFLGKVTKKAGYHPQAAADAKRRLIAFLQEHL